MKKNLLIGLGIIAVVLLVLSSLNNVIGYQNIQSSNQKILNKKINPKELLIQTITDLVNNKEIQKIILKSQIGRSELRITNIPTLTKNQLKQMYLVGSVLSKTINRIKIHYMIEKYQTNNQVIQKEINAVIQEDDILNREMKQLSDLRCDCENENTTRWNFPILCTLLFPLVLVAIILYFGFGLSFLGEIMGIIDGILNCPW